MLMTKTITVGGIANQETIANILTSTSVNKWTVNRLWITEVTSTLQNNALIHTYQDLYLITQFAYNNLLTSATSGLSSQQRVIDIGVALSEGSSFYVGHVSGATASNMQYTIEYETTTGA